MIAKKKQVQSVHKNQKKTGGRKTQNEGSDKEEVQGGARVVQKLKRMSNRYEKPKGTQTGPNIKRKYRRAHTHTRSGSGGGVQPGGLLHLVEQH